MPALPLPLAVMCNLACEASLLPRVRMAIAVVAQEVFAEDGSAPGYPLRWNLAKTVLSPTQAQAASMMVALVVSPDLLAAAAGAGSTDPATMAAAITDEQILDAIRQGWNAVAGVNPTVIAEALQATT
ncbi:hypothetical protein [Streptomyces sp. NBC_00268]|uniref:hypothetical protein n=1 Tax=Streptomyces sp. NBC_00268 TaxID=2975695 RepID=UPI002252C452|nr:hypothetical protein [Streptomyces sp. NBC_00268]MCX5182663.1 hypothetical protein [Streptomyces sp. NBC_00268]